MRRLLARLTLCLSLFCSVALPIVGQPPVVTKDQDQSQTVFITKTGKKYHRDGCSYLKSRIPISLKDAKARGYTPCSRCNPPK